jgi:hypothetical protein
VRERAAEAVRIVLARRVYRTGVQTVELEDGHYFVTIKNRTYQSEHEVPYVTAMRYLEQMKGDQQGDQLETGA